MEFLCVIIGNMERRFVYEEMEAMQLFRQTKAAKQYQKMKTARNHQKKIKIVQRGIPMYLLHILLCQRMRKLLIMTPLPEQALW